MDEDDEDFDDPDDDEDEEAFDEEVYFSSDLSAATAC